MEASNLHRWDEIEPEQLNPLTTRQYVVGTNTMLARLVLKKGAHVPLHSHMHEQISHVVEGKLEFLMEGKSVMVQAGEILCIPPHVPHAVNSLQDSVALDIFNPPRQDWIDGDDAYLADEAVGPGIGWVQKLSAIGGVGSWLKPLILTLKP